MRTSGHFVYIYRDDQGRPQYVGYGQKSMRAIQHVSGSHNEGLNDFIHKGKYAIEIAGPFGSEETGRAVETALISALNPECNSNPGHHAWRFRPLGVNEEFAGRISLPPLTKTDLLKQCKNELGCPILFVIIGTKDFGDERPGHDPSNPPSDTQILERINRWWQLRPYMENWCKSPKQSPALLVGVAGPPKRRIIIGAVTIDQTGWESAKQSEVGALYQVPTIGPSNLDAFNLRGRQISEDANIRFGGIRSQFFVILGCDGKLTGGNP